MDPVLPAGTFTGPRACFPGRVRRLSGRNYLSTDRTLTAEGCTRRPVVPSLTLPGTQRRYGGLAASVVLHGLAIGLLAAHGERLWSRTHTPGDPSLSGSSAEGGGGATRVAYITLPSLPRSASPPKFTVTVPTPPHKTVSTPVPEPVQLSQVQPEPADASPAVDGPPVETADTSSGAAADGTSGPGTGPAQGPGDGPGVGPGTGTGLGGEGGTLRPPEPRDMAFPFDTPPKELRGVSLNVTFWVRPDGRVERYQVEPEIKDRDYAKKFDEVMRAFRFTPARAPNGSRVAGTTRISFTLPGKSSS
jgi:hypothetical protein